MICKMFKIDEDDAFGILLAEIYYIDKTGKAINLNDELLKNGLACPYI